MDFDECRSNLYPFKDIKPPVDPILTYEEDASDATLVIDNGSYHCRMGWNKSSSRSSLSSGSDLVYKSVMVKTRKEKGKESELHVANDIPNLEAVRYNLKTPFDRNVVTQFEHEETMLDYGFYHMGINSEDQKVNHPIVMSEAPVNPISSRSSMNELLFENYQIPKVSYGIDGLFSLYQNTPDFDSNTTAMIISFGFHSVHFMPIIQGKLDPDQMRRLNVGGFHLANFLHRGLQLKYAAHANNITIGRAEEMITDHCYVAKDFGPELKSWANPDFYRQQVHRMQLPFTAAPKAPPVDPEILKQRRQELAKRLVEINAKKREEKLQEDEALLKILIICQDLMEQGYDDKVKRMLSKYSVTAKNPKDIESLMMKTKAKIEKAKNPTVKKKDLASDVDVEPEVKRRREDMNEDEKRDFDDWIKEIKTKRQELIDKRSARHLRKQQLSKRRTAASQERMRMISQLAKHTKKDDTFGMNDDDWDVYKKIRKDTGDSDSEEEQEKLAEYENVLREHDPNFDQKDDKDEISRDSPEWYQLHLGTERIRVPEIYFQPSIIGSDQAGISETLDFILKKYDSETSAALAKNVFLTGTPAKLPGLQDRVSSDLISIRPYKTETGVVMATNPTFDAFHGMQKFACEFAEDKSVWMTKAEYEEKGAEHFSQHFLSNLH